MTSKRQSPAPLEHALSQALLEEKLLPFPPEHRRQLHAAHFLAATVRPHRIEYLLHCLQQLPDTTRLDALDRGFHILLNRFRTQPQILDNWYATLWHNNVIANPTSDLAQHGLSALIKKESILHTVHFLNNTPAQHRAQMECSALKTAGLKQDGQYIKNVWAMLTHASDSQKCDAVISSPGLHYYSNFIFVIAHLTSPEQARILEQDGWNSPPQELVKEILKHIDWNTFPKAMLDHIQSVQPRTVSVFHFLQKAAKCKIPFHGLQGMRRINECLMGKARSYVGLLSQMQDLDQRLERKILLGYTAKAPRAEPKKRKI